MRGLTIGLIATAAVCACGDNVVLDGSGAQSGSRLRARYRVAGEARLFRGFHDRERDEACTFDLGPGQTAARCLPASSEVAGYMDPACTVPAFWREETGCELPTAYVHTPSLACGGGIERIWRVGTLQRPPATYRRDAAGACVQAPPRAGAVWYAAIEEVPLERFVAAELREARGAARLHERFLTGEDGSRLTIDAIDTELGVPCTVWDAYGHRACHPDVSEGGWLWADDACTVSLVERDETQFPSCAGPMSPYAALWRFDGPCGYKRAIVEVGEPVAATGVYYGMGTCAPDTAAEREVYAVGAELPASQLAPAQVVELGSGRMRTRMLVADGARAALGGFFDTELGQPCSAVLASDGVDRCLPVAGGIVDLYTDAACGLLRDVATVGIGCGEEFPSEVIVVEPRPPVIACGRYDYAAYAVGAEYAPGTLYGRDDGGACLPVTWDRDGLRYYALGAEIPPDRFLRTDEIID